MPEEKKIKKKEVKKNEEKEKKEISKKIIIKSFDEINDDNKDEQSKVSIKTFKKKTYIYNVGKRKTAVATVRLHKKGEGKFEINGKNLTEYFNEINLREIAAAPLELVTQRKNVNVTIKVMGGGRKGQAEAIRNGIAKTLLELNPNFRKPLKKAGFLSRDSRKKERKKPGLKSARRAPQWRKR
ncbi:MAG: 30S ribosomal protein S9 [bacterium]